MKTKTLFLCSLLLGCGDATQENNQDIEAQLKDKSSWTFSEDSKNEQSGFGPSGTSAYCIAWSLDYKKVPNRGGIKFGLKKPDGSSNIETGTHVSNCSRDNGTYSLFYQTETSTAPSILASISRSYSSESKLRPTSSAYITVKYLYKRGALFEREDCTTNGQILDSSDYGSFSQARFDVIKTTLSCKLESNGANSYICDLSSFSCNAKSNKCAINNGKILSCSAPSFDKD